MFTKNLTAIGYQLIIKNHILPDINTERDIILQDNSGIHNSHLCIDTMLENNIRRINQL